MKNPIITALLAYGMSGKIFHAPFLATNDGFELYGVLERNSKKAVSDYPEINSFDNIAALLADPKIELVIVNTPNNLHFEHAKMVLDANKNLLLEKPATTNTADFQKLLEIAKNVDKKIFVYQNRRFSSDFLATKKVIASGKLGEIVEVHLRFDRYRTAIGTKVFKEDDVFGSGIFFDLGAHLIDQAISLFGRPSSFKVTKNRYRQHSKVDDFAFAQLIFDQKINVFITTSMLVLAPQAGIVIHGTKGSFVKNFCDQQEQQLLDGMSTKNPAFGQEKPKNDGILTFLNPENQIITETVAPEKGDFNALFESVYDNLRFDKPFVVDNQDIICQISILESL